MTSPRIVVPGATTAITRRTTLRKAFLAPWDDRVTQIYNYALADAQRRTDVAIHHAIPVVTHHHLSVTPERSNLPRFLQLLHHDVSCALNTLLANERYDQPGEVFDDRSTHTMRLVDAPAQASTLQYEYLNCAAAGLVTRPEHMPGYTFNLDLWKKGYLDVRRPDVYFGSNRPEVIRLQVTPPPMLLLAFNGDMDKLVYWMQRMAEEGLRDLRAASKGRTPLGARKLRRMHPWSEPRTLRETRGRRIPTFRIGARDITGRDLHIQGATEVRQFRRGHGVAMYARAGGDLGAVFPFGTYQMHQLHGAPVAEAPRAGEALLTCPGPLMRDVLSLLDQERQARSAGEPTPARDPVAMCEAVRGAFREEAAQVCELASEAMDFGRPPVRLDASTVSPLRAAPVRSR